MQISLEANYYEESDFVLGRMWVFEGDYYHPESVRIGEFQFLTSEKKVLTSGQFDRYYGNSDGSFTFILNHPRSRDNIILRVELTLVDGTLLNREESAGFIPKEDRNLAENIVDSVENISLSELDYSL